MPAGPDWPWFAALEIPNDLCQNFSLEALRAQAVQSGEGGRDAKMRLTLQAMARAPHLVLAPSPQRSQGMGDKKKESNAGGRGRVRDGIHAM